jgi:hypothetical protein
MDEINSFFEQPEEITPSELMAIGTFVIFMLVTLNFFLSVYSGMIMLGIFSLLSREK